MELSFFLLFLSIIYVNSAHSLRPDDRKSRLLVLLGNRQPIGDFFFKTSAWANKINDQRHQKTSMNERFHHNGPEERRLDRSTNLNSLDFTVNEISSDETSSVMEISASSEEMSAANYLWSKHDEQFRDYEGMERLGRESFEQDRPDYLSNVNSDNYFDFSQDDSSSSASLEIDLAKNSWNVRRNTNVLPHLVRAPSFPLKIH